VDYARPELRNPGGSPRGWSRPAKQFRCVKAYLHLRVKGYLHLPALPMALDQTVAATVTPTKEDAV
jgi:hypothetical protein